MCAYLARLLYWIVFEIFESLHSEINHFQAQRSVLICGDLNARTGSLPEYTTDNGNNYIFGQSFSKNIVNFPINNTDDQVNINREAWLISVEASVCTSSIAGWKGILMVDKSYSSCHDCSTVDYMITDLDPFSFRAFTVKPLTPLSDHSQITLYLKRTTNMNIHSQPSRLYNIRENYRWAQNSTEKCHRYWPSKSALTSRQLSR